MGCTISQSHVHSRSTDDTATTENGVPVSVNVYKSDEFLYSHPEPEEAAEWG